MISVIAKYGHYLVTGPHHVPLVFVLLPTDGAIKCHSGEVDGKVNLSMTALLIFIQKSLHTLIKKQKTDVQTEKETVQPFRDGQEQRWCREPRQGTGHSSHLESICRLCYDHIDITTITIHKILPCLFKVRAIVSKKKKIKFPPATL